MAASRVGYFSAARNSNLSIAAKHRSFMAGWKSSDEHAGLKRFVAEPRVGGRGRSLGPLVTLPEVGCFQKFRGLLSTGRVNVSKWLRLELMLPLTSNNVISRR